MILLFGILFYTMISIWFFLSTMGMKFREERWYEFPLMLPILIISYIVDWCRKIKKVLGF